MFRDDPELTPSLRQQLSYRRSLQLGKERTPMYRAEVAYKAIPIEFLGYNGEATGLLQV